MKFGWGFTGELRLSDSDNIRVYDAAIDEVVRLDNEDVAAISRIDDPVPRKREHLHDGTRDTD